MEVGAVRTTLGMVVSLISKTQQQLGYVKVLKRRRKYYHFRLGEIKKYVPKGTGQDDRHTRYELYIVLNKFSDILKSIEDGEGWAKKAHALMHSRMRLAELDECDKQISKILGIEEPAKVDRASTEDDDKDDYNFAKKVVTEEEFGAKMRPDARKVLADTKALFQRFGSEKLIKSLRELAELKGGQVGALYKVLKEVQDVYNELNAYLYPTKEASTSTVGLDSRKSSLRKSNHREEKAEVMMLDLSLDYKPMVGGGVFFEEDSARRTSRLEEVFVFFPGTKVHSIETTVFKQSKTFIVKFDGKQRWSGKCETRGEELFDVEEREIHMSYEDAGNTWYTSIDGIDEFSLPQIGHSQLNKARQVQKLRNVGPLLGPLLRQAKKALDV